MDCCETRTSTSSAAEVQGTIENYYIISFTNIQLTVIGYYMSKRNYLLILAIILVIFGSYSYLSPLGDGYTNLKRHDYSLITSDINNYNKYSSFRDDKNGKFIIYAEEDKSPRGMFTFNLDKTLILDFSMSEDTSMGAIEFIVKKNEKEIDKSVLAIEKENQVILKVNYGDKVEIIAEKYGKNSSTLGNLQITIEETTSQFKNMFIPFLWSLLFIFLFIKKHSLIAVNAYFIFLLMLFSEKLNFGVLTFLDVLIYTLFVMSIAFLFTLLYQEFYRVKKFKIASFLSFLTSFSLYVIPLSFIVYALNYDTEVTKDVLYAIFQSNGNESIDYISDFIALKWIALFVIIPVVIGVLLLKQEKKETIKIEKSLLIFIIVTLFSVASTQILELRLPKFVVNGFDRYQKELKLFRDVQARRKAGEIQFSANKNKAGETYIVIIGESLNKRHMGIYGYPRNTTPNLSKMDADNELLVFQNVYANHTHTVPVLSLSLTEANQMNKKTYYDSLSIIDILNKADVETYWLSNQVLQGVWDNMVSVVASETDHLVGLNHSIGAQTITQKYDGVLINEVQKALAEKTNKNKVIFVHLMGHHTPYYSRYPEEEYSIFKGELNKGEFGKAADIKGLHNTINAYDNSIVYNDYVVGAILKTLQEQNGTTGFIYMSDHADDAIERLGHNSAKFTYEMTQIPMLAWFSPEYKKQYSDRFNTLNKHRDTLYPNDFFYDTLIGLFNIKTDKYESKYDLSSHNYNLAQDKAYTLHGKKLYTDKTNYNYWQKVNTQYLRDINQSSRVFPHRINSIGKLKNIWNDGFRSFEIDTRFGDNNTSCFQIGHNHGVMGINMENFLSSVSYSEIERVWLDFKNLNKNNYKQAIERLDYLDKKFDLKRKFIVESGTTLAFFKEFKKAGWHSSYYMPTEKIVTQLKENNVTEMKKLAVKIASQTKSQNLSAVSFDHRLYPFVKQYLEPLISDHIVYHVWYGPTLRKKSFPDELQKNKLYLDKRVKTLLSSYSSPFDL